MSSVKTAISLPEDVFASLVRIATETGQSRSAVVAEAVEALARRRAAEVRTAGWNQMGDLQSSTDAEWRLAESRALIARQSRVLDELGLGWED